MESGTRRLCTLTMRCVRLCLSVVLGMVIWLSPTITAYADNTEDLLNVYGLTLGGPIKSEIEKRMDKLEADLIAIRTQQGINEEYNALLEQYVKSREEFIDKILVDVNVYQSKNDAISGYIGDNIMDGNINDLIKADAEYKTNTSYINELLSNMNNYKIDYSYKNVQYDMSDVESQLTSAQQLYIESLDTFDLGKVKDIDFVLPIERRINSSYGYRQDPLNRSEIRLHAGVDYYAGEGTDIYALFNGTVISSGWSESIGYFVTVQSGDNVKYLVCHCSELCVSDGQLVKQGDIIAKVGGTGTRCTGPHLHMALYLNGVSYDVDRLFR